MSKNVTVIFNPDVADGSCVGGVVIHKCFYSFTHYITLHIKFNPKTSNNKDKLSVINQKITPHTYIYTSYDGIRAYRVVVEAVYRNALNCLNTIILQDYREMVFICVV